MLRLHDAAAAAAAAAAIIRSPPTTAMPQEDGSPRTTAWTPDNAGDSDAFRPAFRAQVQPREAPPLAPQQPQWRAALRMMARFGRVVRSLRPT